MVLAAHRRNGGTRSSLDFNAPLLSTELGFDSLDLAEIMAQVERVFGVSPFDQTQPPRVWSGVAKLAEAGEGFDSMP